MSPSGIQLGVIPGNGVRLKESEVPSGGNPREVFDVQEAPAHRQDGALVLRGRLSGKTLNYRASQDVLLEKVED